MISRNLTEIVVAMRRVATILGAAAVLAYAVPARAHAYLDHASPAVGSAVAVSPPAVTLWFTGKIEPAFSHVTVADAQGRRVDLDDARVPPNDQTELQIGLKPLAAGTYTVHWSVVSVDTHPTEGTFTFQVGVK